MTARDPNSLPVRTKPLPLPPVGGRGHSDTVLIATGSVALTVGIVIGAALMWFLGPPPQEAKPETEVAAAETATPSASSTAVASPPVAKAKPKFRGKPRAMTSAQRRLAKLRKVVKGIRHRPLDKECKKYFKTKLPAGYVYSGAKFNDNEFVANMSGCKAVAKASKANWFCCAK